MVEFGRGSVVHVHSRASRPAFLRGEANQRPCRSTASLRSSNPSDGSLPRASGGDIGTFQTVAIAYDKGPGLSCGLSHQLFQPPSGAPDNVRQYGPAVALT